jgi:catechol-2,3-dioxygenase
MSAAAADGTGPGILELRLETHDLAGQRRFYTETLGLPLAASEDEAAGAFTVQAGATRLTFAPAAPGERPLYHFAFNIPENKLSDAMAWMARRTPVLRGEEGQELFHFESWNAHAFYFHDAVGNIAELIARHDLANARPGPFAADDILAASEIGLVVDDVPATVRELEASLGLAVYRPGSDRFAPVGDEHRLLIVNHRERGWWEGTPSRPYPVQAWLAGSRDAAYRAYKPAAYPYEIVFVEG